MYPYTARACTCSISFTSYSFTCIMNFKCLCVKYCSLHRLFLSTSLRSSSSLSVDEVSPRQNGRQRSVLMTKNGWRRSVPAMKWLAMNCTRDKMAGGEKAGDETATTKGYTLPKLSSMLSKLEVNGEK